MARTPNPELQALWRDRIRRQEASGMTIEQFCAQEGVARSKFQAWKRRFRLADAADQCPALPARSTFLPVAVRLLPHGPGPGGPGLPIEAALPNGVCLRIPTGDPRLACRIVRALAAAKTNSGGAQ
jgi:putative transposase